MRRGGRTASTTGRSDPGIPDFRYTLAMPRTLFVSDVHLRAKDPANNRPFLKFLEEACDALYIVGDLFDYWNGPKHLGMDDYRPEIEAIHRKSKSCPVFF